MNVFKLLSFLVYLFLETLFLLIKLYCFNGSYFLYMFTSFLHVIRPENPARYLPNPSTQHRLVSQRRSKVFAHLTNFRVG